MNSMYFEAGKRIRKLREKLNYTREEMAEIANISPKFLYEIESGQKGFSANTLLKIAKGLSVTCEEILVGDKEK
ncbi:helix-turn-helix domain-containing protein [[Clostridium] polysaccharolyticum]|uniref:DNA-binding transcriptional regulator, XRE-family HTH domain n=1 Tax=[Clostridium] polysaccharolyticum TaxID=29364 RepID=A0A1I0C6H6_9FIRM|nr:helix-turn-helix transcriptional regulator [[Clostridium] polysaccharolyticum]SET14532.1 DNA-binding transcriptional regulator, XRE-family HTH domain [[Clostridium] polysaccharolyticum]